MRKIILIAAILILASLILIGGGCEKEKNGFEKKFEKENLNIDKEMSAEAFYNKYCPNVISYKPGLYKDVNECVQVQTPGEKEFYSFCLENWKDKEKCKDRVWKEWRQVFLKNLAGIKK